MRLEVRQPANQKGRDARADTVEMILNA